MTRNQLNAALSCLWEDSAGEDLLPLVDEDFHDRFVNKDTGFMGLVQLAFPDCTKFSRILDTGLRAVEGNLAFPIVNG